MKIPKSIEEAKKYFENGDLKPTQLIEYYLEVIKEKNPKLNAVLQTFSDALDQPMSVKFFTLSPEDALRGDASHRLLLGCVTRLDLFSCRSIPKPSRIQRYVGDMGHHQLRTQLRRLKCRRDRYDCGSQKLDQYGWCDPSEPLRKECNTQISAPR